MKIGLSSGFHYVIPILCRVGSRHHNDHSLAASSAPIQVLEDFNAPLLRQVDIQYHHCGTRGGVVLVGLIEEARSPLAIVSEVNLGGDAGSFERLPNQENVSRVILHDENMKAIPFPM